MKSHEYTNHSIAIFDTSSGRYVRIREVRELAEEHEGESQKKEIENMKTMTQTQIGKINKKHCCEYKSYVMKWECSYYMGNSCDCRLFLPGYLILSVDHQKNIPQDNIPESRVSEEHDIRTQIPFTMVRTARAWHHKIMQDATRCTVLISGDGRPCPIRQRTVLLCRNKTWPTKSHGLSQRSQQ